MAARNGDRPRTTRPPDHRAPRPGSWRAVGARLGAVFVVRRSPSLIALLLMAAPAVVGCTNLLGLDGLSYEEPPADTLPDDSGDLAASGGSGGGFDVGEPGPPPNTFPEAWAPSLLIAGSSDALGTYYAYAPSDGALLVRQGASTTLPLREDSGGPGWDLVHTYSDGSVTEFVGYDRESGLTDIGSAPSASAALSADQAAGTPGWTALTTLTIDAVPHAFVYSATTGSARVGAWEPESEGLDTTTLSWPVGLSDIAAAEIGGESGVVRFEPAGAVLEFVPVTSTGVGVPIVLAPLPAGTTRVVVVPRGMVTTELSPPSDAVLVAPDANVRLLAYDRSSGTMTLLHVEDSGALHELASAVHRAGLDAIVPLRGADWPFALLYSGETGIADVMCLEPFSESPPVIIR